LQAHGFYESDVLEDCGVFLFVFAIGILYNKISKLVETWNKLRIQPQKGQTESRRRNP
jgi:hypothetical protein